METKEKPRIFWHRGFQRWMVKHNHSIPEEFTENAEVMCQAMDYRVLLSSVGMHRLFGLKQTRWVPTDKDSGKYSLI